MTTDIGVTVIVPTLNRGGYLYNSLCDLLAQTYRPLEILVVDQSDDVPADIQELIVLHSEIIRYYRVSFRGLPQARNYGWQHARYDKILYVDDDIRCGTELVQEHSRALDLPNVGAVAGAIDERYQKLHTHSKAGRFNRWTAMPLRGFSNRGAYKSSHFPGGNFAIWKHVISRVGGVDEALNKGAALLEETELAFRVVNAGYDIYFNGAARLEHLASPSGGCRVQEVDKYVWSLAHNRALFIRRHSRWYEMPTAIGYLCKLFCAYALRYRKITILAQAFRGTVEGWRQAVRPPRQTDFLAA